MKARREGERGGESELRKIHRHLKDRPHKVAIARDYEAVTKINWVLLIQ